VLSLVWVHELKGKIRLKVVLNLEVLGDLSLASLLDPVRNVGSTSDRAETDLVGGRGHDLGRHRIEREVVEILKQDLVLERVLLDIVLEN